MRELRDVLKRDLFEHQSINELYMYQ